MGTLSKDKLETILTARLPLQDPDFRLERVGGRLVGNIISPSFRGKRDHQRQDMIWKALEAALGPKASSLVGMLLAYTPDEWHLGEEDTPIVKRRKAG